MTLRCPSCHGVLVIEGRPPAETICPSCGSSFQLDPAAAVDWTREAPPRRLGRFEFLEPLGVGSFGTVYKARDTELDRIVAVKIPRSGSLPAAEDVERFLREAKSAAQLQHPGIVTLHDAGIIDGTCCLVSEFIAGTTLAQRLGDRRFGFRQAAELVADVAQALHYAHEHGIVHRDIKPSNIMLDGDGRPHLTDFGLAKRAADETSVTLEGQVLGTPAYMAPEQARGEVQLVDARSDLYGLGVVLYELLTGEVPFSGQTRMVLLQVIQDEPRPPRRLNDRIPRDLETICLKAMAKEPGRRYPTAQELAADLGRFLRGEPILARPVGNVERFWRWCGRNPRVAGLSAVVLALLVAIAVSSTTLWLKLAQEKAHTERARKAAVEARDLAQQNERAAKDAQALAEKAQEQAEKNAVIANEQGRLAVNSLYTVVTRVQQQLRTQPRNQKLRQQLLADAFAGLEKVVTGAGDVPLTRRTRSAAHQHMGDISRELGRNEAALEHYREARKIIEAMAAQAPGDQVTRWNQAVVYDKLGDASHELLCDGVVARDYYRKCLELRRMLANAVLTAPELNATVVKERLATSYAKEGNLALMLGNPAEAWSSYQEFLELRQWGTHATPLAALEATNSGGKASPLPPSFLLRLGELSLHLQDVETARGWYSKALALSEAAWKHDSESGSAVRDLAGSLAARGDLEVQVGDVSHARDLYLRAHPLYEDLAAADPEGAGPKRTLSLSHYRLGTAYRRLGETAKADEHYRSSLSLRQAVADQEPGNAYCQIDLMLVLARCGQHREAADRAEKLRARVPKDPATLFFVACTYALCVPAATTDTTAESGSATRYGDTALEMLSQAVAAGFQDLMVLRHDPDLDPVRPLPRFQALAQSLERR